ncbi:MAG: DoxX family protein [Pseudonocardia sp.]
MTAPADHTTAPAPSRAAARTVLVLRILLGLFLIAASALPKLLGEAYAVQIFDEIGAGDWFRYFIGVVELAGGIGLLVPALAGPAAVGIVLLMVGAGITQVWVLDQPQYVITPIIIAVLAAVIARHQFRYRRQAA